MNYMLRNMISRKESNAKRQEWARFGNIQLPKSIAVKCNNKWFDEIHGRMDRDGSLTFSPEEKKIMEQRLLDNPSVDKIGIDIGNPTYKRMLHMFVCHDADWTSLWDTYLSTIHSEENVAMFLNVSSLN